MFIKSESVEASDSVDMRRRGSSPGGELLKLMALIQ